MLFTLDSNATENVSLPQDLGCTTKQTAPTHSIVFETDQALILKPGDDDIPITATEGVRALHALLGISLGIPNAEFVIPDKGVVFNTVSISL